MGDFADAKTGRGRETRPTVGQIHPQGQANELAGQLLGLCQQGLDSWWQGMLSDRSRLSELSERLQSVAGAQPEPGLEPAGSSSATAEDLAAVVEALALMESKVVKMEREMGILIELVNVLSGYLDSTNGQARTEQRNEQT